MKILVVGKGNPQSIRYAGHEFQFVDTPKPSEQIPTLAEYNLALFHLSQDCTTENGGHARVLDEWNRQRTMKKVIAITGGGLSEEQARRLRELGDIPFVGGIASGDDVLRLNWATIPVDSQADAWELVERLKGTDPVLTALYILCQAFLLSSLRLTLDGTGYKTLNESGVWDEVGQNDANTINSGIEEMQIDLSSLGKVTLPSTHKRVTFWSAVCIATKIPACNKNGCLDPNCDIGKWLLTKFGPLQNENTRQLFHHIRLGSFPTPVLVVNAGVELARLHQVLPATQSQEGQ